MGVGGRTNGGTLLAIEGGKPARTAWLPYGHQSISETDIAAVEAALRSEWLTQGPLIEEFERAVAKRCQIEHAVAFSSGTAALHGAYYAAGISAGDEVITTGMSFAATSNAALYLGASVTFADIDPSTGLIEPKSVESRIGPRSRAIVGVDFAGQPCDAIELSRLARDHGLHFIVDAAHSLGSIYDGQPISAYAEMTVLSFHPVKHITTGEGGMVLTHNTKLASELRAFRTHGIVKDKSQMINPDEGAWYHEMQFLGYNYRMTEIQAALGISQLNRLDEFVDRRKQIASIYRESLSDVTHFTLLEQKEHRTSSHHLFPILVNNAPFSRTRRIVFEALHAENIGVQVHYIPTYKHPHYQRLLAHNPPVCPNTDEFYSRVISLPIFPAMTDQDVRQVIEVLTRIGDQLLRPAL